MNKELKQAISGVPKNLPLYLGGLTTAGHLHSKGYNVQEQSLRDQGYKGCAIIFMPILIWDEDRKKHIGSIETMWEVRMNLLLPMQEIANECGVSYRTIQRWRDENKITPVVKEDGKQLFPAEIVADYAARQGHLKGHKCWR